MSLEEFNYIAEIVASVAGIAALIYVALEVRQNTIAVRLNTLHDVKETIREVNLVTAEHGDLAEIVFEGCQDLDKLIGAPKARFYTWAHNLFLGYENLYLQFLGGALDPPSLVGYGPAHEGRFERTGPADILGGPRTLVY